MAFDVVVRSFWTDSGLSAGLASANEKLRLLGRSGPNAATGLRSVEMGARMLAFQAVGLPGPLGRVAGGMLQLSGGSALMLAVVAGLGLAGAAIRDLTQDARENAAAQDAMIQKLGQLGPHGEAAAARIRLAELERQRNDPTFFENALRNAKALGRVIPGM